MVSVEFVLIFPLLFLILYAIITYGLVFGAQQTLSVAAAEGGRAALRYQSGATSLEDAQQLRAAAARDAAQRSTSWLRTLYPDAIVVPLPVAAPCAGAAGMTCFTVRVEYNHAAFPLLPSLMGLPVPDRLRSEAVVQLSPLQLL